MQGWPHAPALLNETEEEATPLMRGSQEGFCFNRDAATLLLMAAVMAAIISRPRRHTQGTGVTPALMPADAHLIQTLTGLSHSDGHEIAPLGSPAAGRVTGVSAASLWIHHSITPMRGHISHRLFLASD